MFFSSPTLSACALAIILACPTSVLATESYDSIQGCWMDHGTLVCKHPVDDSVKQLYGQLHHDDHYGRYVAFGRTDGTEAILMLEPNKISLASSRYFCYIACDALMGTGSEPSEEKVGLVKILGYYDASQTCQPMAWPASGRIEHPALNSLCASRFKDMVPNAQKWRGSGDTFFWMLHTEEMIHLQ